MKKDLLKKVIEENTKDGVVDFTKVHEEVTNAINGAIKSTKETTLEGMKKDALEEAKKSIVDELKIEGVTNEKQLKAHISKLSSTETSQELIDAQKRLSELETENKQLKNDYDSTTSELSSYRYERSLIADGIDPKDVDYHAFKINKLITDEKDFETAKKEYLEANPSVIGKQEPVVKTTGTPRVVKNTDSELMGFEKILEERGKLPKD